MLAELEAPSKRFPMPVDWALSFCHSWDWDFGFESLPRNGFPMLAEVELWTIFVFPGRSAHSKSAGGSVFELRRLLATKLIGLCLATAGHSLDVLSCPPLDVTLCFPFKSKWLHEDVEKFMMFNNFRR